MTLDEVLDQLARLPRRVYTYVLMSAMIGPFVLRTFGFSWLAGLVRPVALTILLGGMIARQVRTQS